MTKVEIVADSDALISLILCETKLVTLEEHGKGH